MDNKYKTVHLNKNEIEQLYSELTSTYKDKFSKVLNDLYLEKYPAEKFKYKEEDYWIKQIGNLPRYDVEVGDQEYTCDDGIYLKFKDVINLLLAKTDLEKITNLTLDIQSGLLRTIKRRIKSTKDDKKLGKDIREIFGEKND